MPVAPTIPCQTVRGTIGKLSPGVVGSFEGVWTYCLGMHGPFVKAYTPMTIEPGHFPTYDNNIVGIATTLWRNLTDQQRATWTRPAYRKRLPPYTYFVGVQLRQFLAGLSFLVTPTTPCPATVTNPYPEDPITPDCSGTYALIGFDNGHPHFLRDDSAYHILLPDGSWSYYITDTPDDPTAGHFWENLSLEPTGGYWPTDLTTGYPQVAYP